ncbi:MAG: hypothetical protein ACJ74O_05345 [Frankiaceae bacterium]
MDDLHERREQTATEREFDLLMARRGNDVPADRRAGAVTAYGELLAMAARLHQPRAAESEPAILFDLETVLRAG